MNQRQLSYLWREYELTGDTEPLAAFVEAHMTALAPCGHEYPQQHRIREVRLRGRIYCVMRCVECGERLTFAPTNVIHKAPGVPYWLQGEMLAQWVADETESPAKEAVDWQKYSLDRPDRVSLWLGDFTECSDFESYLDDGVYWASDDETTPLNRFAAEFGIGYYDHDFQDAHWSEKGKVPVADLLKGASYVDSFIARAVQAAEQAGWRTATAFVLLYDFDYSLRKKPPSDSRMVFMGTFDYTKT